MLHLQTIGQLAVVLKLPPKRILHVASHTADHIQHLEMVDHLKPHKAPRPIVSATGDLRRIQGNILRNLFGRLSPLNCSFGGIKGRSTLANAREHINSTFGFTTDVKNFFGTVTYAMVWSLFKDRLQCSDEVAAVLTKLMTFDGVLCQGFCTSPVIADQVFRRSDARILGLCKKHDLVYTRFIDDLTISGEFRLDQDASHLVRLVRRIITEAGFSVAEDKESSGHLVEDEILITQLRLTRHGVDVKSPYIFAIAKAVDDHESLQLNREFTGQLQTKDMLCGKIRYIRSINPRRCKKLLTRCQNLDWDAIYENAVNRGLMVVRSKELRPRAASVPT